MGIRRSAALAALVPLVASTTVLTAASTAGAAPRAAGGPRPNIVLVLTDDLDAAEVSTMPNVRSLLADEGETFSNYFVSNSLCCPSRATTLRGQYAHDDGVRTNGGGNGGFEAAHSGGIERSTIATWLHDAGYRTALIGKYLNGYPNGADPRYRPPGWDDWITPSRPGDPYDEYDYTLDDNGRLVHHGRSPADYGTDVYVRAAHDFVERAASGTQPFFLYLAPYAPHRPATPAPRDAGADPGVTAPRTASYDEADVSDKPAWVRRQPRLTSGVAVRIDALYRRRLQSLRAVDDGIGDLVATLRSEGRLDDTYFVFTSDNGFHLGQHRLPAGKETAYDEDIHVPLVIRGPGVPARRRVDTLVGNVDLAPTFADLAGVSPPPCVDGRSFGRFLAAPDTSSAGWRNAYLLEHWQETPGGPDRAPDLPLEPPDPDQIGAVPVPPATGHRGRVRERWLVLDDIPDYRGIRTARHTYVEYRTGERELYDLATDPSELRSLPVARTGHLVERLHAELAALAGCSGEGCRRAEEPDPDR